MLLASRKGCCEGQVGITDTLEFGERPSTLPLPLPPPLKQNSARDISMAGGGSSACGRRRSRPSITA